MALFRSLAASHNLPCDRFTQFGIYDFAQRLKYSLLDEWLGVGCRFNQCPLRHNTTVMRFAIKYTIYHWSISVNRIQVQRLLLWCVNVRAYCALPFFGTSHYSFELAFVMNRSFFFLYILRLLLFLLRSLHLNDCIARIWKSSPSISSTRISQFQLE